MPKERKRDLLKRAIREYAAFEGPSLEQALEHVGLTPADLAYWQRRKEWPELFAEVAEERMLEGLPIAVSRLVAAAKTDKSAAGVSAARAVVDITRPPAAKPEAPPAAETEADVIANIDQLSKEERELLCKVFGRLRPPEGTTTA